ncbi:hypothetical protein FB446DRAFT_796798 [Lentinula raphanica]|nr:hypothetical protein FB446DRAFT_796798 [Lentinula raphanica]
MPKALTNKTTFVNPASLSLPSTSDDMSSPSPEPHPDSSHNCICTEQSSEEGKEARAHRNRIPAQNSRDLRKAQSSYLEQRVAELEEENRQLRAGMGLSPVASSPAPVLGLPTGLAPSANTDSLSSAIRAIFPPSSSSRTFSCTSASTSPLTSTVALSSSSSSVLSESSEAPPSFFAAGGLVLYDPYCVNISAASPLEVPNPLKMHRQSARPDTYRDRKKACYTCGSEYAACDLIFDILAYLVADAANTRSAAAHALSDFAYAKVEQILHYSPDLQKHKVSYELSPAANHHDLISPRS